ncbi:hypothetical protein [Belnapia moabensis]|uniref:hypothetical protein n=1 Tax=Belnapia moabensis TaxID=365533 RepID=UPI0005BC87B0|nr:hypothetical protein [Belnapia moabensis]
MRPELQQLLRSRFPILYEHPLGRPEEDSTPFKPEIGDGWFAILLALSGVLDRHVGAAGLDRLQVVRIQSLPRGGLHCYVIGQDNFVRGAVNAAFHMSLAVSSLSGRPGRPMVNSDGETFILAPDEVDGHKPAPARFLEPYRAPIGAGRPQALNLLGRRWSCLVSKDIDVPAGWVDVADVVLSAFSDKPEQFDRIQAWHDGAVGQLVVGWDPVRGTASQAGAVAFAVSMAALVDPVTGASGPVDNEGAPEWWRHPNGASAAPPVPWGIYDSDGDWHSREDLVAGPIDKHSSIGALVSATHWETGGLQISLKPSVAQVMRQMASKDGADGCAAMLAKFLKILSVMPRQALVDKRDGNTQAVDRGPGAINAEADLTIRMHASAARAQLITAAAAARGTAREESLQAAYWAVSAVLDSLVH